MERGTTRTPRNLRKSFPPRLRSNGGEEAWLGRYERETQTFALVVPKSAVASIKSCCTTVGKSIRVVMIVRYKGVPAYKGGLNSRGTCGTPIDLWASCRRLESSNAECGEVRTLIRGLSLPELTESQILPPVALVEKF